MFDSASKAGMMCWVVGGDVGQAGAPRQRPSSDEIMKLFASKIMRSWGRFDS